MRDMWINSTEAHIILLYFWMYLLLFRFSQATLRAHLQLPGDYHICNIWDTAVVARRAIVKQDGQKSHPVNDRKQGGGGGQGHQFRTPRPKSLQYSVSKDFRGSFFHSRPQAKFLGGAKFGFLRWWVGAGAACEKFYQKIF